MAQQRFDTNVLDTHNFQLCSYLKNRLLSSTFNSETPYFKLHGMHVRILLLLWQIYHFHFVQVGQLITHFVQGGGINYNIIDAMFYDFLIPFMLTNMLEKLTVYK